MMTTNEEKSNEIRKIDPMIGENMEGMLKNGESINMSVPADLSLSGEFKSSAFFLTNMRIVSFDSTHPDGYWEIALEDARKMEIEAMYGNFILKVSTMEQDIEINRFTNSVRDFFDSAVSFFNEHYADIKTSTETSDKKEKGQRSVMRCPNCGRPLRKKNSVCPFCIDKRKVITRLLAYVKPYRKVALKGLIFSLIATSASLAPPYFSRILVDDVVLKGDLDLLWTMVALLLLIYLIHAIFVGLRNYNVRTLAEKIVYSIRTQVFAKMQRLSIDYFDKRSTGAIMSRVSSDTQQLRGFIIQATQNMLAQILTLIIIGIVMFSMHWKLALVTLVPIPLVVLGARIFVKKVHPIYHRVWRRRARMNAILGDSIPGIRVIKAFTGEDKQTDSFNTTSGSLLREQMRAARMASMFTPTVSFFMMTGGVIIWGLGGYWVITDPDQLSLGVLVAFISYAWSFFAPIQFLAGLNDMIQQATTSAERVFEILDASPEPDLGKGKTPDEIKGRL